jgi:hypothetical protein
VEKIDQASFSTITNECIGDKELFMAIDRRQVVEYRITTPTQITAITIAAIIFSETSSKDTHLHKQWPAHPILSFEWRRIMPEDQWKLLPASRRPQDNLVYKSVVKPVQ